MALKKLILSAALMMTALLTYGQQGEKTIILSNGEKTKQVNPTIDGLDLKSLKRPVVDTMFYDMSSYNTLEEAVYDTDRILRQLKQGVNDTGKRNNSLSFQISEQNIKKEREAKRTRQINDSLLALGPDVETTEALNKIYQGKPTFYINGIAVGESVVAKLRHREVLSKTIKTTQSVSDNPNGEVWYVVSDKVFSKLGLGSGTYELPLLLEDEMETGFPREGQPVESYGVNNDWSDKELDKEIERQLEMMSKEDKELAKELEKMRKEEEKAAKKAAKEAEKYDKQSQKEFEKLEKDDSKKESHSEKKKKRRFY